MATTLACSSIASVLPIINITNVDIRAKDKPELNSTITVDCVVTTFVLLADEIKVPAAPAKSD